MSNIKELLDGVEVELKTLGEVCDFKNGFAFKKTRKRCDDFSKNTKRIKENPKKTK